jgi:hypothetical protein
VLLVDVGLPACSLDIRSPGPAEQALLRRVADELGAGRPPNRHRAPEDVALALIDAAKAARSLNGTVTARELLPWLDLAVDFGAVHEGHPVDATVEITRPTVLDQLATAGARRRRAASSSCCPATLVQGSPGCASSSPTGYAVTESSPAITAGSARANRAATHQLVEHRLPPAKVYALACGHRRIVQSPHNPG